MSVIIFLRHPVVTVLVHVENICTSSPAATDVAGPGIAAKILN
jgi:hypothetical protein